MPRNILRRLQHLIHRRQREEDLQREMRIHREMMGEPHRFGNTLRLREESRDVWGWNWLDNFAKDVIYGLRQLRKTPGFTVLAILTLAIAIGGITTFSGLMKAALFADLPARNPHELRQIVWNFRSASELARRGNSSLSYPVYRYIQEHSSSFSDVVCWSNSAFFNLRAGENLVQVTTQFVSGNFFAATGLGMSIGRPISSEDEAANAAAVSILSYGAWQRLFGGDAGIIGRRITLNGSPFIVAGVMANNDFQRTPQERWDADVILPVSTYSSVLVKTAGATNAEASCRVIGRMAPQISTSRARQESEELVRQAFLSHPILNRQGRPITDPVFVDIRGLRTIDQLSSSFEGAPLLILLLIGALLAIVCSNIAGMTLACGAARRAEVATRLALGASRRRIIRQLLTESVLLALIGGGAGVALSFIVKNLLPWPFAMDLPVLVITAAVSCATGLLFGLAPALTATRLSLNTVMKQASPGSLNRTFRSGNILIGVQVTLSLLMLVAAGLEVNSLARLMVPSSFEPERVLTIQAYPRTAGYTSERSRAYFEDAVKGLEGLPGIVSATLSTGDGRYSMVSVEGDDVRVIGDYVGPRFFETMKIPVLLGRGTTWSDAKGAPLVAVVNEAFARTLYEGTTPLGKTVRVWEGLAEIVGIVADSNNSVGDALAWGQAAQPSIYIPFQQRPDGWGSMLLSARTTTDAEALASAARRIVQDLDADVVVDPAKTQASQRNINLRERRLIVGILALAGAVALLEVSFAVYGMLSFFVGTRTAEIGLRIALGARRVDVIRMVLRKSLVPVAIGGLLGLLASPALILVLDRGGFLIGAIRIIDQLAVAGAALFILGIALTAAIAPARRASRLSPMQALRHE